MRILVAVNLPATAKPWWIQYLPDFPEGVTVEIVHVTEARLTITTLWQLTRLALRATHFDVVITFQDGYATFFLATVNALIPWKRYKHIVHEFITREQSATLYSRLKYRFLRFALSSVDAIHCSARTEIAYYRERLHLPHTRFRYVPLSTNPKYLTWSPVPPEPIIVSAGRTGRDYRTLLLSVADIGFHTVVVADPSNLSGLDVPANVDVKYNIPQDELAKLMSSARFVVVPLENRFISVGQSVILIAMAVGKAVISNSLGAITEYVIHGETGLLVPPTDPRALREAMLHLLERPGLADQMGKRGRTRVASRFVPAACAPRVCASARWLLKAGAPS